MNSTKNTIICIVVGVVSSILIFGMGFVNKTYEEPKKVYQIYLDGEKLGIVSEKEDLYNLINQEQGAIKDYYQVDTVYPPKGFDIMEYTTYDDDISTVEEIYDLIKDEKDFTIKGYTITVKNKDEDYPPIYINVLKKEIFEEALNNIITTFVGEKDYKAYIDGTQVEIVDVGSKINNMYFEETITTKESYISVNDKIYTNATELTEYLLFGDNTEVKEYTVKSGDSIESIAYNNQLNAKEFLIANPKYKSVNTLLAVGEKVNVKLIDPVLTFIYEMEVKEDIEIPFETEVTYDYSRGYGYKKVEQEGVNGISRITKQVQIINGVENQGAYISEDITIRAAVNEKVVKGRRSGSSGVYIDTGYTWAWPTNSPYIITTGYEYRWGSFHYGLDISGTGHGSPIYAALEGTVIASGWGGILGDSSGYNIVIQHPNGYYTSYAHMSKLSVRVGDTVTRGQEIGKMGSTGFSTGPHLHYSVSVGVPYSAGFYWVNPYSVYK